LSKYDTTTRQGNEASTVVPSRQPSGEHRPGATAETFVRSREIGTAPRKVQQALANFPKGRPVSIDEFTRQKLRLPYGRWITNDEGQVLFNRDYEMLLIWPAGAERPERCDPHWGDVTVQEGRFYSDGSAYDIGTPELHHALEALLDAWERGDRATAEVLEEWLLSQHKAYQELIRACQKEPTQENSPRTSRRHMASHLT
jgi:hypothetical protein